MGTNFYLRSVKPREVYDEFHIAKRSWGWRIHFQDSEEYKYSNIPHPTYHSVSDIRNLLESGEYQLTNEYGETWEPGEESLKEFDELCEWNGGEEYDGKPCGKYPYGEPPYENEMVGSYRDDAGYLFISGWFR